MTYFLKTNNYGLFSTGCLKGKEVFADRRNPDMVCEITLCGQSHILSEFDIAYEPDNSSKEYMEAYAVFSEPVNAEVENWIMRADRKENGTVRFYLNSDAMDEGALFEINFSNASCVHYHNVSQGRHIGKDHCDDFSVCPDGR